MSTNDLAYLLDDPVDYVELDLTTDGRQKAPKNDKIALIDADTIAYATCCVVETSEEVLPREMYSDTEWADLMESGVYDEANGLIYTLDMDKAIDYSIAKIQKVLDLTGCKSAELHFTMGRNFRYDISPEYKANRKGRVPAGLSNLKHELVAMFEGSIIHTEWEADDYVVWAYKHYKDRYILCAVDKDVYNSVEGTHFNYYEKFYEFEPEKNILMDFITVDTYTAVSWVWMQTLMGDTTDNVKGLKGIGKAKAPKLVEDLIGNVNHNESMRKLIGDLFMSKGMTKRDSEIAYNLVRVDTLELVYGKLQLKQEIKDFIMLLEKERNEH